MTYNTRIRLQQGGSEFSLASGASLNFEAGAVLGTSGTLNLSGGYNLGQASAVALSGGLTTYQTGASLTINHSASDNSTFKMNGPNSVSVFFNIGRDAPAYSASPGAVYFRSDGSMSAFYFNISSGTTGSVWRSAASG